MRIPDSWFCPISFEIMKNPVIDPEGYSYEKAAIEEWLKKNPSSPITRTPLKISELVPNRSLKDSIDSKRSEMKKGEKRELDLEKLRKQQKTYLEKLEITSFLDSKESGYAKITITPPKGKKRYACDICCVIDVSGSMQCEAKLKNEKGTSESHGLSILDVVKHAVKTVIGVLNENDRLSIVTFTSTASVVFKMEYMTKSGKKRALAKLNELRPLNSTNLWDGIKVGLDEVKKTKLEGRISSLFLLTDGVPNIEPPRGHLPTLKKYADRCENSLLPCSLNMFGFGYSLDSKLLDDLACFGNGTFAFIPDAGFVGTVFVNTLSNVLASAALNVRLSITAEGGAEFNKKEGVLGSYEVISTSWGKLLGLGSVMYGQTKDVVIKLDNIAKDDYLYVKLEYYDINLKKDIVVVHEGVFNNKNKKSEEQVKLLENMYRLKATTFLRALTSNGLDNHRVKLRKLIKEIKDLKVKSDFLKDLLIDLSKEVELSIKDRSSFTKWGKHYSLSLGRTHLLQECNNFKDPGVQHYGGNLFEELRDKGDDVFCDLPPPKPKKTPQPQYNRRTQQYNRVTPQVSMRSYYSSHNVCFGGSSLVKMENGQLKKVENIKKGDVTQGGASIRCVIKTNISKGVLELCEMNSGLLITPWHPVRVGGIWKYPCDLVKTKERSCDAVYNFVLDKGHVMFINGIECVTLGHSFKGEVVGHYYFGSNKVIEDLSKCKEMWNNGLIEIKDTKEFVIRDSNTKLISGIKVK